MVLALAHIADADDELNSTLIRVKAGAPVPWLGSEIVDRVNRYGLVTLRCIGAGAVLQATKGIVNARQRYGSLAEDLITRPGCVTVKGESGDDVTAIIYKCELRRG